MPVINRDLASAELWERSLERSQRRRVLADSARKEISRRKTATYAVSAAVAASPMWPGISGAVNELSGNDLNKVAHKLEHRDTQRVLLQTGDEGPAVKALQKKLEIPEDGTFGQQTRAAVRDFQKRVGLDVTGEVNVKTWLKLFPDDMIVYAPPGTARALGADGATTPQWTAVNASQVEASAAAAGEQKGKAGAKHSSHDAIASAASLPGLDGVEGGDPATGDVPTTDPGVVPPVVPGVPDQTPAGPPPSGGHGGVLAPGENTPSAPSPGGPPANFPVPGGSVGEILKTLMSTANKIDKKGYAYSWGGGHNMAFSGPYDCSGAVSAVLHAAGLLNRPMVSGEFMRWGAPGPGAVTIYANAGHVYMSILGKFFGTSGANPGGGAGWFQGGARPGFAVVHVPFSKLHLRDVAAEKRKKAKIRAKKKRRAAAKKRRAARRQAAAPQYSGPSGGAQAGEPSSDAQPQGQPAEQPAPQPAPEPAPAPAPVVPPAAPAPAPVTPEPPVQQQAPVAQQAPAQQAPAQSAPQQGAPAQQAPAEQAPAQQPAPQQSAPQAPAAPVQQAPAQPAPVQQAPAQPAPQPSAPAAPQAPAQPAPQQSTPAPQAPTPPVQSAPAGDTPGAQPSTPPATAPKPGGGESAGGDSGAAASG